MRFARWTFLIAGGYGLLALVPMYFMEAQIGGDIEMTHPEYFYGFIGVAIAFQLVFLKISSDPKKYRALMLAAVVEKLVLLLPSPRSLLPAEPMARSWSELE